MRALADLMPSRDSGFFGDALAEVHRTVERDSKTRLHNLGVLLENLTSYFQACWPSLHNIPTSQDQLQSVVLMELPLISIICRDPESGGSRLFRSILTSRRCHCRDQEVHYPDAVLFCAM